jgi:hypothetical protein
MILFIKYLIYNYYLFMLSGKNRIFRKPVTEVPILFFLKDEGCLQLFQCLLLIKIICIYCFPCIIFLWFAKSYMGSSFHLMNFIYPIFVFNIVAFYYFIYFNHCCFPFCILFNWMIFFYDFLWLNVGYTSISI